MFDLKNKTILITGGAGLIGSAFSESCAKYRANVVVVDIEARKGNELVNKIKRTTQNESVIFQKCDITNPTQINKLTKSIINKFGKIDALVNSAYPRNKHYGRRFEDVEYKDFCENINQHLGGYFLMSQKVADIMKKQNYGNIINIASIYGFSAPRFEIYKGTKKTCPVEYSAIKGAIVNLTKYLASYLGRYNIRVNAISPGGVLTNEPEVFVKNYLKKVILGKRMAKTDDLTEVLVFLLSDASKYITGQNIVVDGGWTL